MNTSIFTGLASHSFAAPANGWSDAHVSDARAQEVKSPFQECWAGYYRYTRGHDELHPQQNCDNDR